MKIADLFYCKTDQSYTDEFNKAVLEGNLSRGRILTLAIALIESIMVLVDFVAWITGADSRFAFRSYMLFYVVMAVVSLAFAFYAQRSMHLKSVRAQKTAQTVILAYSVFALCWGSAVALIDQRLYGHITAYLISVIAISTVFNMSIRQLILAHIPFLVMFFIGLPQVQPSTDVLIGHIINAILFILTTLCISRILYAAYVREFNKSMLFEKINANLKTEIRKNQQENRKLEQLNLRLQESAMLDELTGLHNRRGFQNYIDNALECNAQEEIELSIIMIDVDQFKSYNDIFGHIEGDKALVKIGRAIDSQHRASDFVARFGGEEFIFVTFNANKESIAGIAQRIRNSVCALGIRRNQTSAQDIVTISLGVCTSRIASREDILDVILRADQAMYRAKANGGNCVVSAE